MKITASAKNIRISPRKVRLVIDQVRGLSVTDAERVLVMMNKKAATPVLKLVRSAAANAVHNNKADRNTLVVSEIQANEGFTIKRYRARAFGRAAKVRKRTTHISIVLTAPDAPAKPAKKTEQNVEEKTSEKTAEKKEAPAKKATPKKKATEKKKPAAKKSTAKKKAAPKKEKSETKKTK